VGGFYARRERGFAAMAALVGAGLPAVGLAYAAGVASVDRAAAPPAVWVPDTPPRL
jgi:hypothetical protein